MILRHDGAELAHFTLPPGEYVIGRSPEVEIFADTALLSRRHARLTILDDQLLLEDLGSSNGTFLDDQPVTEPTPVFSNQAIRFGPDLTLEVRLPHAPAEPGVSLAPAPAAIRRFLPAEILTEKRYAIGGQIARGGMGAILDARQAAIKRQVAMKVMLGTDDKGGILRFIEEAQITGQLEHPNIVPIYELGVDEQDQLFYTMKLVRGITLKKVLELLAEGVEATVKKYPLPALLTVFQKVCDAVAFAHAKGVIHRDLKPENIMLGDFGSVLVMDWGLAKIVGRASQPRAAGDAGLGSPASVVSARAGEPEFGSTMAGTIMGTPQYMSPEQARGEVETLDARSDVFALGAILFHLLHLRPAVTGRGAMEIVGKVARGEIEWKVAQTSSPRHSPPDSLLAVCRKALTFDRDQRYASVENLQRDLTAYQAGFATSAEKAGAWKQLALLVKRHKATSIGLAAVLMVGVTLGTKALIEGRRAERAITELRRQAPALRQFAESEAVLQHFDSALEKLDAALALDPAHRPSYWQRAWLFIGMERLADAATAIRLAQQKDPAHRELAAILPAIEELATLPPAEPWPAERARVVWDHLVKVGASGEIAALSAKMRLIAKEKEKLVRQRLDEWLGQGKGRTSVDDRGVLSVDLSSLSIDRLDPLKGLPIDALSLEGTKVMSLEPLRGMRLVKLNLRYSNVADLLPLRGMPLRWINLGGTQVKDLSPLGGAPLEFIHCNSLRGMTDFSPLQGAPLRVVSIGNTGARDLGFLADAPIEELDATHCKIADLSPLRGKPLKKLLLIGNGLSDLAPLRGAAIEVLHIRNNPIKDFTPLLDLPKLEKLSADTGRKSFEVLRNHPLLKYISDNDDYRPAAEFWKEYDAQQAAGKK